METGYGSLGLRPRAKVNETGHPKPVATAPLSYSTGKVFYSMKRKYSRARNNIPESAVHRLLIYHRTLTVLEHGGVETISSEKLADIEGFTAAQVRKDLSFFGSFGYRGVGYKIRELKSKITNILGLNQEWDIVLIGAGDLGEVLMNSRAFSERNFRVSKIFDKSSKLIGKLIKNVVVAYINDLEVEIDPAADRLAVVALPPDEVQDVVNRLGKIGVKGVLYFASRTIEIPDNMVVRNQDISIELGKLTYYIANNEV